MSENTTDASPPSWPHDDAGEEPEPAREEDPQEGTEPAPPSEEPSSESPSCSAVGEDEAALSPDSQSHRMREREQRSSGFDAPGTTYIGAVHITDSQSIGFGGGSGAGAPSPGHMDDTKLNQHMRVHQETTSDPLLAEKLSNERIVFLCGTVSSGRNASATIALARWSRNRPGSPRVSVLHPDEGLGELAARLNEGSGHLLDATGQRWPRTLAPADLSSAHSGLVKSRAALVVLIDDPEPNEVVRPYLVFHQAPDLDAVLRAHLATHLDTEIGPVLSRARRDPAVRAWSEEMATPAEAAELAAGIAAWSGTEGGGQPSIVERRHRLLCGQARHLLSASGHGDSPTQQAYVLATAVLDRHSVSTVIRAAGQLTELLRTTENPGDTLGREVFTDFLHRRMRHVRIEAEQGTPTLQGIAPRQVVRMREPRMAGALLDVTWSEFDAAREPLLRWLTGLCEDHDSRVRISAAQALGRLAGLDFSEIKRRVIVPLGDSSRPVHHQAASWLLEKALKDGVRENEVRSLLRSWIRSGKWSQVAVALRGYTTEIARDHPKEALRGIRESVLDNHMRLRGEEQAYLLRLGDTKAFQREADRLGRQLRGTFALLVATALAEMYAAGQGADVLKELISWARMAGRPRLEVPHAFLRIAITPWLGARDPQLETGSENRYDLLARLADSEFTQLSVADVAALWATSLLDSRLYRHAWEFLTLWDVSAGPGTPEHPCVEEILKHLGDFPELRPRLALYQEFRSHRSRRHPDDPTKSE